MNLIKNFPLHHGQSYLSKGTIFHEFNQGFPAPLWAQSHLDGILNEAGKMLGARMGAPRLAGCFEGGKGRGFALEFCCGVGRVRRV